ncbi:CD276 antigen-like [Arapaima gigas]
MVIYMSSCAPGCWSPVLRSGPAFPQHEQKLFVGILLLSCQQDQDRETQQVDETPHPGATSTQVTQVEHGETDMNFSSSLVASAVIIWLSCGGSISVFEITVPREPQVAIFGCSMVLLCSFPVKGPPDYNSIIITWQRDLKVVHSFYYNQDQLAQQSSHYINRTTLYHSQLASGNASLRLDHVTPDDSGNYTCSVTTELGSQKKTFPVKFAAFYTEPQVQLTMSHQTVQLLLTSQGYPEASLQWLDDKGQDVTNETVTQIKKDDRGLYAVSSTLIQKANKTLTFILTNKMLNQEIRRELGVYLEPEDVSFRCQQTNPGLYVLLTLGGVMLVFLLLIFLKFCSSKAKRFLTPQNGHRDKSKTSENLEAAHLQGHL